MFFVCGREQAKLELNACAQSTAGKTRAYPPGFCAAFAAKENSAHRGMRAVFMSGREERRRTKSQGEWKLALCSAAFRAFGGCTVQRRTRYFHLKGCEAINGSK